jgi:hypothetical protein
MMTRALLFSHGGHGGLRERANPVSVTSVTPVRTFCFVQRTACQRNASKPLSQLLSAP